MLWKNELFSQFLRDQHGADNQTVKIKEHKENFFALKPKLRHCQM
jgi:hypothetical protein